MECLVEILTLYENGYDASWQYINSESSFNSLYLNGECITLRIIDVKTGKDVDKEVFIDCFGANNKWYQDYLKSEAK